MDKNSQHIWNLVYTSLFLISFFGTVVLFGIWVNGEQRGVIRLYLLSFSITVCAFTLLHLANYILRKLKKKTLFKARLSITIVLMFISCIFISWSNSFKPAPKLVCSFDKDNFIAKIKSECNADSVFIKEVVIQEEIYFPKIIAPRIIIVNASLPEFYFKVTKNTTAKNREKLEAELKERTMPYAETMINSCNMSGFNDLIIEFVKVEKKTNKLYNRFINHYDEKLVNSWREDL